LGASLTHRIDGIINRVDRFAESTQASFARIEAASIPARLSVPGAVATMTRERAYWRATFERVDRDVTMSGLSGERFDEFVADNVGASIATFLEPFALQFRRKSLRPLLWVVDVIVAKMFVGEEETCPVLALRRWLERATSAAFAASIATPIWLFLPIPSKSSESGRAPSPRTARGLLVKRDSRRPDRKSGLRAHQCRRASVRHSDGGSVSTIKRKALSASCMHDRRWVFHTVDPGRHRIRTKRASSR
jgi:hypothetical protein